MTKLEQAKAFIQSIRDMSTLEVNKLIMYMAGEELARFCQAYGTQLTRNDPEAASSLMLMGYLIRSQEEENEDNEEPDKKLLN